MCTCIIVLGGEYTVYNNSVRCIQMCGAFVFGAASFTDKLSSGVAIALIQQFSPRKYVGLYVLPLISQANQALHCVLKTRKL